MTEPMKTVARRDARDLTPIAEAIDQTAAGAMELFKGADSFAKELKLALAMQQLRAMLTAEVMAPIMELMNTQIGFRTDRDPKRAKPGERVEPYGVEEVRDCFIESKMRGFRTVGNEWNIIAGGFYAAKEGFRRRLTDGISFPLLSNLKDSYDVPRLVGDKGAIVKARATWLYNGVPDSMECEFAVRVNSGMGADGITGKAERKLLRRIHDRLTGVQTPEGEVGDTGPTINVGATEVKRPAFNEGPPTAPAVAPNPVLKPEPAPQPAVDADPEAPVLGPNATRLSDFLETEGIPFGRLQAWCVSNAWEPGWDSIGSIGEVSERSAARLLNARAGLQRALKPAPAAAQSATAA